MTHGHELKEGNVGGRVCAGRRGIKGGKWDNCNSKINKIYLKKKKKMFWHSVLAQDSRHLLELVRMSHDAAPQKEMFQLLSLARDLS